MMKMQGNTTEIDERNLLRLDALHICLRHDARLCRPALGYYNTYDGRSIRKVEHL